MIPWLVTLLLAANAPYIETSVDGLYIGSTNPLNGQPSINVHRIDINGDQKIDLVFADQTVLQHEGVFNQSSPVLIPLAELGPEVDFFNDTLFMKFPDRLMTYRYLEDTWTQVLELSVEWPEAASAPSSAEQPSAPTFERFVYDIDQDGTAELIFPMQDGLHIFRMIDGEYRSGPPLRLFPDSMLISPETISTASNLTRHLAFPDQHVAFHAAIENNLVNIVTQEQHGDSVRFTTNSHRIIPTDTFFSFEEAAPSRHSREYPNYVRPCRLNPDSQIDYAGGSLEYASTLAIITPIYTTTIYSTPDEKAQIFRTKSFSPHTIFTDVDHDGYHDLIQESTHITKGGLRETLNRFTTQKKFKHTIEIHLQRKDHRFSMAPDITKTVSIKLDQTPIRLSDMFERYQAGKLLNVTGDFNKDGYNDLLVQTSETELALYLMSHKSFGEKPNYRIPINPYETFHVIDLNLDGYSDILFQGAPEGETESLAPARVLLFQPGTTP